MADIELPDAPAHLRGPVKAWSQTVVIDTYEPAIPDKHPAFLEKRVYQGSSGRVYPLPFIDAIATTAKLRPWQALHIENEFLRLMVLPEIGGRIHIGLNKSNGYDFFYRQNVIKPALVGLAGPWLAGGVELNWPQHHRPATFMPVEWEIESHADGSQTIWLSDHDPMQRMKGMHGVCLHPGVACVELKVRLFNRTVFPQTFLWWANAAVHAHEGYQSFFPPDVQYVADHARRAISEFPLCSGIYYGVDYGRRVREGIVPEQLPTNFKPLRNCEPNNLSWFANIPVPTSYMAIGSQFDFSGGYDHKKQAGLMSVVDHHIAPGKKQWTWGNHEFGYAWERHLTDAGGPYIELMTGVYTDNQPDFSFLAPGETRVFTQYWYPFQAIGIPLAANEHAAVSVQRHGHSIQVGVAVTRVHEQLVVAVKVDNKSVQQHQMPASPSAPIILKIPVLDTTLAETVSVEVSASNGQKLVAYAPGPPQLQQATPPERACEPPEPGEMSSIDELYITGLHLEQYRHATRYPEIYWREALRRDPHDSRCLNAMGRWHLHRGEFSAAADHFERAIARLTKWNSNPPDGEAFYNLGMALIYLEKYTEAYSVLAKAAWNYAWRAAAFLELARIDVRRGHWELARGHLDSSLHLDNDNLCARALKAVVLRYLNDNTNADGLLRQSLELDPLDGGCRFLLGKPGNMATQVRLDVALDFARGGLWNLALAVLDLQGPLASAAEPMVLYYRGYFQHQLGQPEAALETLRTAAQASPNWCFPSRLEEIAILNCAIRLNADDGNAPSYLAHLFYDRKRHPEAIALWERSAGTAANPSVIWRNLGIAYFNILKEPEKARLAYERARRFDPADARLLYEQDQLAKRMGAPVHERLARLNAERRLVVQRDDLTIEYCTLLNQSLRYSEALEVLAGRRFHPWEGGEGRVLEQFARAHAQWAWQLLDSGQPQRALEHGEAALNPPENLGEAWHPLANQSELYFLLGEAAAALGQDDAAHAWWHKGARSRTDFQQMAVQTISDRTLFSIMSLERLGRNKEAAARLEEVDRYADALSKSPAVIDYFATSLPNMLLFECDLALQQRVAVMFLKAQVQFGRQQYEAASGLLFEILAIDPSHPLAADMQSRLRGIKGSIGMVASTAAKASPI